MRYKKIQTLQETKIVFMKKIYEYKITLKLKVFIC